MRRLRPKHRVGARSKRWTFGATALALLLGAAGCSSTFDPTVWEGSDLDDEDTGEEGETGDTGDTGADTGDDGEPGPLLAPSCDPQTTTQLALDPHDTRSLVSPALARAAILAGDGSLDNVPIRPHEFFGYYDFDYPAAEPGELRVAAGLFVPQLDPAGDWVLQVAVTGEEISKATRAPLNVSLVVDASAQIEAEELELVKQGAYALAANLREGDRFSLIRLGQELPALLEGYEVQQTSDPVILDAVGYLEPTGTPDLLGGLETAFLLANDHYDGQALNRVLYIGGEHPIDPQVATELVDGFVELDGGPQILFSGAAVGAPDTYDGEILELLAHAGHGSSHFLADESSAWRVFDTSLMSTLSASARDLRIEVELPPGFRPLGAAEAEPDGYTPPEAPAGQDLATNRALVLHELLETCAPDELDANSELRVKLRWSDPASNEPRNHDATLSFAEAMELGADQLQKGRAVRAYAQALLAWQEAEDAADQSAAVDAALEVVTDALELLPGDADLMEISELLVALDG